MILLPKLRVRRGNIGNEIFIGLPDLSTYEKTFLNADHAAAVTTLNVVNGSNFAANTYILIGDIGHEDAEIKLISASAAGTLTTAATTYPHNRGTTVRFIPYNQVSVESATSITGSYTEISAVALRPDMLETQYLRPADAATICYKVRFKNVQDTTYSSYSDAVVATGYADNTVFAIKRRALNGLGEQIGDTITEEFLNESLWEARREIDNEVTRLSFRQQFDYIAGTVTQGAYSLACPTTLRRPDTAENIMGLRIGIDGRNLTYISKRDWDVYYENIRHTTVSTVILDTDVSIVLTNSKDFDDSGSITIGSDTITYTGNTRSTGTLTGVTGIATGGHAVGVDVWQQATFSLPQFYTVFEDTIYFNTPFDSQNAGQNIYLDFWATLTAYDTDADVLDEPDYDMFVSWLRWKIKYAKKKGDIVAEQDGDYLEWTRRKVKLISKEKTMQNVRIIPSIEHLIDAE